MKFFLSITFIFLTLLNLHGQRSGEPYAQAYLTSKHLIPGEQTNLIINLKGARPTYRPTAPVIPNTAVNFVRAITQLDINQELTQVFLYRLTPAKTGNYTIPPVTITRAGKQYQSPSVTFHVHDVSELITLPTGISGQSLLAGWFPAKTTLYQGEQCPLTLKVYAPESLRLASWGMPDPAKTNCLAWRFSLPALNELGRVHINSVAHLSAQYETTLSGISPGKAIFGPSKFRIVARKRIIDPRVGPRISDIPVQLTLPKLEFPILPFPKGAPDGFNGAIGQFKIRAHCSKLTLNDTDTTEVTLQIGGSGNLENLQAPQLTGDAWKIIDTSKVTRGKERRYVSGVVTFRQLIRPAQGTPTEIPAYRFSYFDPDNKTYHTLTTDPIPVEIIATIPANPNNNKPAATASIDTPAEAMQGILGFIDSPSDQVNQPYNLTPFQWRMWYLAPLFVCLIIIGTPVIRKRRTARTKSPESTRIKQALSQLDETSDTRTFYRRAGRIIDQWLPLNKELKTILTERDALCFQPEHVDVDTIPEAKRSEIIQLLKRCAKLSLVVLFATIALGTNASAATDDSHFSLARNAWKSGNYQQAIDHYLDAYPNPMETPADVLYNIGNCHHRLDQPGRAVLLWHQALIVDPTHRKARKNLRYVEVEQNAHHIEYESWQNHLTVIHPQVYQFIFNLSMWLHLIAILGLIFLQPRFKKSSLILLFLTPITATVGGLGMAYFPDSDSEIPFEKQAIILTKTALYTEAHREEKKPSNLPTASLVKMTAVRGDWIHVTTPSGDEGWVVSKAIAPVIPK